MFQTAASCCMAISIAKCSLFDIRPRGPDENEFRTRVPMHVTSSAPVEFLAAAAALSTGTAPLCRPGARPASFRSRPTTVDGQARAKQAARPPGVVRPRRRPKGNLRWSEQGRGTTTHATETAVTSTSDTARPPLPSTSILTLPPQGNRQ